MGSVFPFVSRVCKNCACAARSPRTNHNLPRIVSRAGVTNMPRVVVSVRTLLAALLENFVHLRWTVGLIWLSYVNFNLVN